MTDQSQPSWPTMTEYQEAIQSPKLCFDQKDLRKGKAVTNALGLPRPVSGQFASVYELDVSRSKWAIKCFLRNTPDLHSRYACIAEHLATVTLPYFVTFDYIESGIRIRGHLFPIVKMEWVDGLPLNEYVEQHLSDPTAIKQLERNWVCLLNDLRSVNIAHADLQHGNVLVAPDGNLRLIDYDGMWVPQLEGKGSHEIGHPDYQCPLRTGENFDADIDRFAGDVILIALRALARRPELWNTYDNGENLLFKRVDFVEPDDSDLFKELRKLDDDEINPRLDYLIQACGGKVKSSGGLFKRKPKHTALDAPSGNVIKATDMPQVGGTQSASTKTITLPRPPRVATGTAPARSRTAPATATATATAAAAVRAVAVTAPATEPASHGSEPSALLSLMRAMLYLMLLTTVSIAAAIEGPALMVGGREGSSWLLGLGFCATAVVGALSVVTLLGRQPIHFLFRKLFCGMGAGIILFIIFSQLVGSEWSQWTGHDGLQCLLMLTMLVAGAVGLLVERTWRCQST